MQAHPSVRPHGLFAALGTVLAVLAHPGRAEGLAMGTWTVQDGLYRTASPSRALYFLTDHGYLSTEGSVQATVTVRERPAGGGWAAAAVLISSDPQSFWSLSLVEGPDGRRYVELIELYHGIHQAQASGPTRLIATEGTHYDPWEYGTPYQLTLTLSAEAIVGVIRPAAAIDARPLAVLGWRLAGQPALREGWGALRGEALVAEFADVQVRGPTRTAPAAAAAAPGLLGAGRVGVYLGTGLSEAEPAPDIEPLRRRLQASGQGTALLSPADLAAALAQPGLSALVADLRRLPAAAQPELLRWLQRGGLLVSVTAPAFGATYWPDGDRWVSWGEHLQHSLAGLGREARPIVTWSAAGLAAWSQGRGGGAGGAAEPTLHPGAAPDGQDAVEWRLPGMRAGWWSCGRSFEAPPAADGEAVTCFWAKGDAQTPEVSLEWTEADGSRWIAVISLESEWRCYALPPRAFGYWQDNRSQGRGKAGDALHPEQAVSLHLGISNSHTQSVLMTSAAEHHIWLGPIGLARAAPEALGSLVPIDRPEMEALSPGYKLHPLAGGASWRASELARLWGLPEELPPAPALGAIERPGGEGFERGRWWRWVPLVTATDAAGRRVGAPMSLVLSEMLPHPRCAWVSLGLTSLADFADPAWQEAVAAAVTRVAAGPFLFEGGARHFLWRPGEPIAVGARVVSHAAAAARAEVVFDLTRADGTPAVPPLRLPVSVDPRGFTVTHGELPGQAAGDLRLRTTLVAGNRELDRIDHEVTVRPVLDSPPPAATVVRPAGGPGSAEPGHLQLDGQPWHPVGANYWPHNLGGIPGGAYWTGWLDPVLYTPSIVEADLAQMAAWGFTAIAGVGADGHWSDTQDSPPLRNLEDFLWRCDRHHLRVFLFCSGLDPRGRDEAAAARLIRTVRYHPALAAYDIAWEPGYYEARHGYAPQWRAWLSEHYGSPEAAEAALGHALPRTPQGDLTVPPDPWCEEDGPWAAVAAAYRVYMDWQLGAEYRRSARLVRDLDPLHLVGFRGSNVTSPLNHKPVEQPSVLHFMDWAGPEGYDVPAYGLLTDAAAVSAKGMCTRLLSFLSGRKPVIWMEFGMPVYPNGTVWRDDLATVQPARLEYQVEEGRRWWQMMVDSGAWGSFQWWYPGGFRVGENSDCGLVDPANQPRPVADQARRFAAALAQPRPYTDEWLEVSPATAGGWIGEYLRRRDEYARLVAAGRCVDVRADGGRFTSADCPLLDPAGRPWPTRGPLRYLNSIFERVRLRVGDGPWVDVALPTAPGEVEVSLPAAGPLELEAWVGNTAEAAWLPPGEAGPAGGVGLSVTAAGQAPVVLPLAARTAFQASGHFGPFALGDRTAPAVLQLRLQAEATRRAPFGEALRLRVVRSGK